MSNRGTIYLKSAVAGIVTAVLAMAAYIGIGYFYAQARVRMLAAQSPTDTYFVVVHWHLFSLQSMIVTAALFLAGAYWMFRWLRSAVIYVKSILAGAGAFFLYAMLFNLIAIPVMMHRHPPQMPTPLLASPAPSDSSVGFYTNTNWVVYSTPVWPLLFPGIAVFAGTFYWMFRRSRRRGASPESE